ncbi:MAG: flagellar type III secretion system pore protein FliP, partial [Angelakisella sp.]
LFLFLILAMAPSILLMMTSFTRIVIVLSFLRNALGTQQSPPNQILIGLALFLTLFIMKPVMNDIKINAYEPYTKGTITQEEAIDKAIVPIKKFMIRQTDPKSLNLFMSISGNENVRFDDSTAMETIMGLGLEVIVPSFITSELTTAFTIGFLIFLPFLIIDMVVSSILMSMGMVMLPPAMIALPFKIMMFVMVDGWSLLMGTLVRGFH